MSQIIEHVQRTYAESELLDFGKEAATLTAEIEQIEIDKKVATDHFRSQSTLRSEKISRLAANINRGYEIVPTPCEEIMNSPANGLKTIVAINGGEIIRTIPMSDKDRQGVLFEVKVQ